MDTTYQNKFYKMKSISLIFWLAVFSWSSAAVAETGGDSSRIDLFQGLEERGQAFVEGEITRVQGEFVGEDFSKMNDQQYTVETPSGEKRDLHLGAKTQKIGDIFLGDYVQARIAKDGLVKTVQKTGKNHTTSKHSNVHRRITGTVERMDGNFLFVKNGERTEILHLDGQSTLEGNIQEGSTIVAQLGDAGYAIKIQEFQGNQGMKAE